MKVFVLVAIIVTNHGSSNFSDTFVKKEECERFKEEISSFSQASLYNQVGVSVIAKCIETNK